MRPLLLALCLSALTACRDPVPGPEIHVVSPSSGPTDTSTPITIRGERFYLDVTTALDASRVAIHDHFSGTLNGQPLRAVTRVDSQTITAEVPTGLAVGSYDLRLTTPGGKTASKTGAFAVLGPSTARLAATLAASQATVSVGQIFSVLLKLGNPTPLDVLQVTPSSLNIEGAGVATVDNRPAPIDVPGGSTRYSVWPLTAVGAGAVSFAVDAEGREALSGETTATGTLRADVEIQTPPQLNGTWKVAPAEVAVGGSITLWLAVSNAGQATVTQLRPSGPVPRGTATWTELTRPDPGEITGGTSEALYWTLRAESTGTSTFAVSAAGRDRNSGEEVTLDELVSREVVVVSHSEDPGIVTDPLNDGTSFAYVFGYRGQLYLGPNHSGTGAVRLDVNGSGRETVSFAFARDAAGRNVSGNLTTSALTSIGSSGCAKDTPQCGPDNEDGRGLFASGLLGGKEWLVLGGARSGGDLDYVYMTDDTDAALDFMYVDLSQFLGGRTEGVSAMHIHHDRLYLGFPDSGHQRPFLVALTTAPSRPGLDAGENDAVSLDAEDMPAIGEAARPALIDSIADFNDRLYVANNGGIVRSTVAVPLPYSEAALDWQECTPAAAAYWEHESVEPTGTAELTPRDKAVPMMAAFGGRLYFGRNSDAGPQLWSCTPSDSGEGEHCDEGDWSLVAANQEDDPTLTQFNNPSNSSIGLVLATNAALYVGFDNAADGVVIVRSVSATPTTAADFEGLGGCDASNHPQCQGLAGNGLGVPGATRIASATEVAGAVHVVVGDGDTRVWVIRLP